MNQGHLIEFTKKGFYCPQGGFYIDPTARVEKALITHAHSDHAISGHKSYLAHKFTVPILKHRLGENITTQGVEYKETININGVKVTFYPAAHIIGSAQIKLEANGEIWVISGDYKNSNDGISGDFEPVKCDYFVTESTFAMPIFKWEDQNKIFNEINQWWRNNQENGYTSIIFCYSLGKAQRILSGVDSSIGPVILHNSTEKTNEAIKKGGVKLPKTERLLSINKNDLKKALVLAPKFVSKTNWMNQFEPYAIGEASGWMAIRGLRKQSPFDRGFVLSDHSDWEGLNWTIKETGASNIFVTHGYKNELAQWLRSLGYNASEIKSDWELKNEIQDNRLTLF